MTKDNTTGEVLQDLKKNGKERPWKGKKMNSLTVLKSFQNLGFEKKAERMEKCGAWLKFAECRNDNYKKLIHANFCKDRMCPMCNWRRSLKLQWQIMQILHKAVERKRMRFVFVTLTVRNVPGSELEDAISKMLKAFKRFMEYKAIDDFCIGYVRNLEVTYNAQRDDYHHHIHILMAMKPSYFDGKNYMRVSRWVGLWQRAHKLDYTPVVWVYEVKSKSKSRPKEIPVLKAAAEIGKYSVKDTDYIFKGNQKLQDAVIQVLSAALKGRRLIGFGKLFDELHKELKLQNVEDKDADLVGNSEKKCDCPICQSTLVEQLYKWHYGFKNYIGKDI